MKIREKIVTKYNRKTKAYDKPVNLFEGYRVLDLKETKVEEAVFRSIFIQGPKRNFTLLETVKPLTIISPSADEDGPAIQTKVPLFFVSGFGASGKIQGVTWFALIENELVPYRSSGSRTMEPL